MAAEGKGVFEESMERDSEAEGVRASVDTGMNINTTLTTVKIPRTKEKELK
jgi:hypothetical protein